MKPKKRIDLYLVSLVLLIPAMSVVVLYSAGFGSEPFRVFEWLPIELQSLTAYRQMVNMLLSVFLMIVAFLISYKLIYKLSMALYLITLLCLVAVFFIGHQAHGSVRWIPLGVMNFQPSELAKVSVILVLAWFLSNFRQDRWDLSWKELLLPALMVLVPCILIFVQPDLGTALSIAIVAVAMLLLAGIERKVFIISSLILISSLPLVWSFVLKPYHRERVMTLLDPASDPYGKGYHIIQSKIAVGSGQLFGKGFLAGTQAHLEYLPEDTTDFAFSVLAEEWGFVGCSLLLTLYFLLIWRLFWLAARTENIFHSFVCFGFAILIAEHVFINVGMVLGMLPVVGLPLPLFSYGGSSMLMIMFLAGIALNISSERQEF